MEKSQRTRKKRLEEGKARKRLVDQQPCAFASSRPGKFFSSRFAISFDTVAVKFN
jgi:hypothetical protein